MRTIYRKGPHEYPNEGSAYFPVLYYSARHLGSSASAGDMIGSALNIYVARHELRQTDCNQVI